MPTSINVNDVVEEMDREHGHLMQLLDQLRGMVAQPPSAREVDKLLADFIVYMQVHFSNEEKVMHLLAPRLDDERAFNEHIEDHANLMADTVAAIRHDSVSHQLAELAALIEHWLKDHISKHDALLLTHLGVRG